MTDRDPADLAQTMHDHMVKERLWKLNLRAQSEQEAILIAHELRKLGWKAEPDVALMRGHNGDIVPSDIVRVSKRRNTKPTTVAPHHARAVRRS